MQILAYGRLGLKPNEFWDLTHQEFKLMVEGYAQRQQDSLDRDAWILCHLLQPHSKQRLSPAMFGGAHGGTAGGRTMTEAEYDIWKASREAADTEAVIPFDFEE